ncbi:hypothetical protein BP6252_10709 [Coleophoma cylindrospora]|uniref:YCII-related domain-containing protein n=1 Tax=Coleophoma cylindrospora TaxID=1849047 RepID=A0A3D8QTQ2_9HELO|nr:hypothetical protein BP6252_10709 [Coleophoma cylindrospora]
MAEQDEVPARLFDNTMTLEWIVLVEDFPGKAKERYETRPLHVNHIVPKTDPQTGVYNMGGIILSEAPAMGEPLKISGVAAVIKAATREDVMNEIKQDPYYVKGIWDPST